MSNEEAFLAVIRETPDDDASRLIYADWLEERSDPRAEFLRGECLLAGVSPEHGQYAELKSRLRAMGSGVDLEWATLVSRVPFWLEPERFFFQSQGWTHFTVRWQNERLVHFPEGSWVESSPPQDVFPSPEEWRAFWSVMDELQPWEWAGDYGSHIICGVPWLLRLSYRGRALECGGNGFGGDAAPPRFGRFYQAMCRLIKRKCDSAEEENT
jgi:uncharacterized protein (TIGR02996 family)